MKLTNFGDLIAKMRKTSQLVGEREPKFKSPEKQPDRCLQQSQNQCQVDNASKSIHRLTS